MRTSILNFTVVKSPETKFSDAQILLQEFSGKRFTRKEAEIVWKNIAAHKWNMSETLGRDVGFRVATTDFIENFYQPGKPLGQPPRTFGNKFAFPRFLRNTVRSYLEAKRALIDY